MIPPDARGFIATIRSRAVSLLNRKAPCAVRRQVQIVRLSGLWHNPRCRSILCFPPIASAATIKSIEIVFDEGTDATPGAGLAVIDKNDINGTLIGEPADDDDD